MSPDDTWPVIVVGAGPVGLALAGDLGWRGVPCLVLERGDGARSQPKMDLVSVRSMEFCRRWGLVSEVEDSGFPRDYPQDIASIQTLASPELNREPFPSMADDRASQSPQKRERCPQNLFDPILERFVRSHESTRLAFSSEVLGIVQDQDAIAVDFRAVGSVRTVRAQYVVACDGGNSRIREAACIDMSGPGVLTYSINILFRCPGFHQGTAIRPAYRYVLIDETGIWCTVVAINGRDEFRMSIVGAAERRGMTDPEVGDAIRRVVGPARPFEVLNVVSWTRRELVAESYRSGRLLLCGDACHVMSPSGGFGMNTGIGDAVDLAWKLEAVLAGWGGPALLDSYEAERRPVGRRNAAEASANLKRMVAAGQAARSGPCGTSLQRQGAAYATAMASEWRAAGIHLGYRYDASPLCLDDGTEATPDEPSTYLPSARPGGRAPHVWLRDGRSILDLFGRGFVLLRFHRDIDVTAIQHAARARCVPLTVADPDSREAAQAYAMPLVLVRPDGHVAWRGEAAPPDPGRLLDHVRGARPLQGRLPQTDRSHAQAIEPGLLAAGCRGGAGAPRLVSTVTVGAQPSGLGISPDGTMALVTNRVGKSVSVLSIHGTDVRVTATVPMDDVVTSVAFTPDGRRALVSKFAAHKVSVLAIEAGVVSRTGRDMLVGQYPYTVTVTPDGRFGLAGSDGDQAGSTGNVNPVAVIDLVAVPPRVVDFLAAGDGVEGVAVSPRGDYAALTILQGSLDAPKGAWYGNATGRVVLLGLTGERVTVAGRVDVGAFPEGVAFSRDGAWVYSGNFASNSISVLHLEGGRLVDTHADIKLPGPPASLRVGSQ